jgi:hypothetical protein
VRRIFLNQCLEKTWQVKSRMACMWGEADSINGAILVLTFESFLLSSLMSSGVHPVWNSRRLGEFRQALYIHYIFVMYINFSLQLRLLKLWVYRSRRMHTSWHTPIPQSHLIEIGARSFVQFQHSHLLAFPLRLIKTETPWHAPAAACDRSWLKADCGSGFFFF